MPCVSAGVDLSKLLQQETLRADCMQACMCKEKKKHPQKTEEAAKYTFNNEELGG